MTPPHKINLIGTLQLLASPEEQGRYSKTCPGINIKIELVNQWFDDFYIPEEAWFRELFTPEEISILAGFNDFFDSRVDGLPDDYAALRVSPVWADVVEQAGLAVKALGWEDLKASYD